MDQHQQTSWQPKSSPTSENSHWTSSSLYSVPLLSSSRLLTLISKQNAKFTFIWKEDFGPLSNSPVPFLLSPGKILLKMFLSMVTLDAPTPASVHSLWSSPKCFAWQYFQAWGHLCCLYTFSYLISSFQLTLHLICFDTALLEQPLLSVITLCDLPSLWRVSMFIFWTIAKSAVFSIIVVSKNKRFILYGW